MQKLFRHDIYFLCLSGKWFRYTRSGEKIFYSIDEEPDITIIPPFVKNNSAIILITFPDLIRKRERAIIIIS